MRPSIRQVAERANVSAMTVTRVLRGRKSLVSDETFERVMLAVRDLNYVPVASALQNRHVQTGSIGIVPSYDGVTNDPIDALTFEGLCSQARQHSYDLLVMLRDEQGWMNRAASRFLDRRSDGFIFISNQDSEWQSVYQELQGHDIPVVVCYSREAPEGVAWVDPDNDEIVRLAVEHLRQNGHRRIAYLSGPATEPNFDDQARQLAFRRETEGLEVAPVFEGGQGRWELKPEALPSLLHAGVTGVVCVNDYLALQLWEAADIAGVRVPEDLSIVGVDDMDTERRGLTTIGFGYSQVGRLAVEAWVALQSGKSAEECCRVVPVHLVERASVAALKS